MNSVVLIGRLTKDPEVRYTGQTQMAVATFALAIDRPTKQGQEKQTDFPRVTVFGRQAENCERFLQKGSRCGVQGRLQTGSYKNRDGVTVYTTDVIADRVEFLEFMGETSNERSNSARDENRRSHGHSDSRYEEPVQEEMPDGFEALDEECPF